MMIKNSDVLRYVYDAERSASQGLRRSHDLVFGRDVPDGLILTGDYRKYLGFDVVYDVSLPDGTFCLRAKQAP